MEPEIILDFSIAEINGWIVVYSGIHTENNMPIDAFILWVKEREQDIEELIASIREMVIQEDSSVQFTSSRVVLTTKENISVMGSIITINSIPVVKKLINIIENQDDIEKDFK